MRDVTIGQYYPGESIVHRLDPRVKLFATLVLVVMLFVVDNFIGFGFVAIVIGVIIALARLPFGKLLRGVRGILLILIFSAVLNMFFTPGHALIKIGIIKITGAGLVRACYLIVRLVLLVIATSIMTLTTKPTDMADGLEKAFGFLKVIKFPVHEIAMIMSLALRFIPTLMDETEKIKKAQMARGADFESGNILVRAKSMVPILVPLFVSSIMKADGLAQAMDARCYNGGKRTKLNPLKYRGADLVSYLCSLCFIAAVISINYVVNKYLGNTPICF